MLPGLDEATLLVVAAETAGARTGATNAGGWPPVGRHGRHLSLNDAVTPRPVGTRRVTPAWTRKCLRQRERLLILASRSATRQSCVQQTNVISKYILSSLSRLYLKYSFNDSREIGQ